MKEHDEAIWFDGLGLGYCCNALHMYYIIQNIRLIKI